ncbi:hypothetical protein KsCSTR_38010 [Candidatus Kuenenia stuttgartiensis]|jgi:Cu/Ag efflux pump CusA|uniref:Uncharacterized protein n=1 Tax=Kuenenia stuttgartiensis TaxID=174633 RepID=Q1Q630_KUEST|nr:MULTISPECIES: hypothetical protein [Kuenenia]MBE7548283.1 hypothetical protein [Planctomycetia bacterium]MBZ0190474.1 hypothetical protein [Candidatus Kuenenia stuttgartiensis]MCL4726462.1 hypothetical protein [Candidatus Kuenenia stuttgartiensis]MCZ7621056.1 hypothetical protein [Candidatus Kuenenia sp.]QII13180.1 hypothetical protein KsCSTR_38010 [Candidatus Kuenenia stuttgartiensis]
MTLSGRVVTTVVRDIMAIALIGGLIASTLIILVVLPAAYKLGQKAFKVSF